MSFEVIALPKFKKELKALSKKYPSLKAEYQALIEMLEIEPASGIYLGNNCYKIRLAIASKNKGKSGGARVITYVVTEEEFVYLLSIYDKSEQDSLGAQEPSGVT